MALAPSLSGACECGRIYYTSTAAPQHLDFCYCLTCQRLSGAPFAAWMGVSRDSLQWHGDQPAVYRATVADTNVCVSERTFCMVCGSNLSIQYYLYPDKTHVAAATMRESDFTMPRVGCHIWVRQRPAWYTIPRDDVDRFDEFDDDFKQKLDQYLESVKPNS